MKTVRYALHPACRVRREAFGLLFYDLRGPRLLFAETGDLLDPRELEQGVALEDGKDRAGPGQGAPLGRLLSTLVEKGFLREQPVC